MKNWTKTRKYLIFTCFLVVSLATSLFSSCGYPGRNYFQQSEERIYYNGYLGLEFTVPDGWLEESVNEINMTDSPEESERYEKLEIESYFDGGGVMELITIQNRRSSSEDDHTELSLYAEDYFSIYPDINDYVDSLVNEYTGDWGDGYSGKVLSRNKTLINNLQFECLTVSVEHPENNVPFVEEYYVSQIQGMYLILYINYWADEPESGDIVRGLLESNIVIGKGPLEDGGGGNGQLFEIREGVYYNGYLGLTVYIDERYQEVSINPYNLTPTPAESATLAQLEKTEYIGEGYAVSMLNIDTSQQQADDNYAMMDVFAEGNTGYVTLDDYIAKYEEGFTTSGEDGYQPELLEKTDVSVNGQQYTLLRIKVDVPAIGMAYIEEHYICQIKDLYFVVYLNYNDNEPSREEAMNLLLNSVFFDWVDEYPDNSDRAESDEGMITI